MVSTRRSIGGGEAVAAGLPTTPTSPRRAARYAACNGTCCREALRGGGYDQTADVHSRRTHPSRDPTPWLKGRQQS